MPSFLSVGRASNDAEERETVSPFYVTSSFVFIIIYRIIIILIRILELEEQLKCKAHAETLLEQRKQEFEIKLKEMKASLDHKSTKDQEILQRQRKVKHIRLQLKFVSCTFIFSHTAQIFGTHAPT